MKDDTTCIVVDIIPPDNSAQSSPPPKKQSVLKSLLFRKKSHSSNKLSKKLSAIGLVEELFEDGSAMLADRFVFPLLLVIIYIDDNVLDLAVRLTDRYNLFG